MGIVLTYTLFIVTLTLNVFKICGNTGKYFDKHNGLPRNPVNIINYDEMR